MVSVTRPCETAIGILTLRRPSDEYQAEGKYNEAVIPLENALQIDPKFAPALHALHGHGWRSSRRPVATPWRCPDVAEALRLLQELDAALQAAQAACRRRCHCGRPD